MKSNPNMTHMKSVIISLAFCLMTLSASAQIYIGLTSDMSKKISLAEPYSPAKLRTVFGEPVKINQWQDDEYYDGLIRELVYDDLTLQYVDTELCEYLLESPACTISICGNPVKVGDNMMEYINRTECATLQFKQFSNDAWGLYVSNATFPTTFLIDNNGIITSISHHE